MALSSLTANQLKHEQSPYLQQHADNPVAWMPWNEESLGKAKTEGKLIFLSIGYSTCHWCHVMEKESFETEEVAKTLAQGYVAIKIDREEMPQLDSYYQTIYQLMNGRGGGWPLTIIMTPDAKPFWSATYLPQESLISILTQIQTIYQDKKEKIEQTAQELASLMQRSAKQKNLNEDSDLTQVIQNFKKSLQADYDEMSGGFGTAPKFPRATLLEAMLDLYNLDHDKSLLMMAENTLKSMASGGIYDQIESGFYRYSVDGQWHIPHFEKMLYTQAELLRVYAKAYLITHNPIYQKVMEELIFFVNKRFGQKGLLMSASDADSLTPDGTKKEGYYFVFTADKTKAFLNRRGYTPEEADVILDYFHISTDGNFEDNSSNPHTQESLPLPHLGKVKKVLSALRAEKPYPFVDQKILTSWNALYISALTLASKANPNYGKEATSRLEALLDTMYTKGVLYHQKLPGHPLKVLALFEDYAFLIDTLVDAYALGYNDSYLSIAQELTQKSLKKFYDQGSWYLSDDAYKTKAGLYDSAYASPVSVMTRALFKLSLLTDDLKLYKIAERSIKQNPKLMRGYPDSIATAFDTFLGYKQEYQLLKGSKKNLLAHQKEIITSHNPYLLTKAVSLEKEHYLGCTMKMCFAEGAQLQEILVKIRNRAQRLKSIKEAVFH